MAPKIVFSYFDFPALGEQVRLALAMSGHVWEDKRITADEFKKLKPTLPFKQLPLLEVDGTVIPQSFAQLRYAGKIGGLYPTDDVEAAKADAAMDAVVDIHYLLVRPTIFEKDPEKKAELRKQMAESLTDSWLPNLEKVLEAAGGSYFAGGKLSIGDISVVCRLNWLTNGTLDGIPTTILDNFPLLSKLVKSVMSEPKIVAYLESKKK